VSLLPFFLAWPRLPCLFSLNFRLFVGIRTGHRIGPSGSRSSRFLVPSRVVFSFFSADVRFPSPSLFQAVHLSALFLLESHLFRDFPRLFHTFPDSSFASGWSGLVVVVLLPFFVCSRSFCWLRDKHRGGLYRVSPASVPPLRSVPLCW